MLDDGDEKRVQCFGKCFIGSEREQIHCASCCCGSILFLTFIILLFLFSCLSKQRHVYRAFLTRGARESYPGQFPPLHSFGCKTHYWRCILFARLAKRILFLTFISLLFPFSCDSKQRHVHRAFLTSGTRESDPQVSFLHYIRSDARRILGVASSLLASLNALSPSHSFFSRLVFQLVQTIIMFYIVIDCWGGPSRVMGLVVSFVHSRRQSLTVEQTSIPGYCAHGVIAAIAADEIPRSNDETLCYYAICSKCNIGTGNLGQGKRLKRSTIASKC
jgi:hypothetical protein